MADKVKHPRAAAIPVARELCAALTPFCERIMVCGSLRRRKQFVGDVEILFVPKLETRPEDLFSTKAFDLAEQEIERLLKVRAIEKRLNVNSSPTWGPQNKYAIHTASRIPVDLFSTTAERWWMAVVIRTGPADFNPRLAVAAKQRGLNLHAYGEYTRIADGEPVHCESERHVFELVGWDYVEPWLRT